MSGITVKELKHLIKDTPDDYTVNFYHDHCGLMFKVTSAKIDHEARQLDVESDE